ncbi:hypothetical protein O6H91_03G085800 [Diphasiastrum complanatum]|uniref:Uncharacterized protein n=2 Tax=Diphasiastrum complanatum TaxID=34168 RepID=A0ACC2E976_DIPCM|nr:hypothetical protein O6H91_03G085800 [Diphasiastrum complanatum]KAJ7562832.1 hypothetical protein O6H91_03G085800 [Diphasiastrum complanatum]
MVDAAGKRKDSKLMGGAVVAGAAIGALLAAKLLLGLIFGRNREKKHIKIRWNLSPSDIKRQCDEIIARSKEVHDAVASVPLDKVTYATVIAPLANLEVEEFVLIQSCTFLSLVAASKDIRQASAVAESKIDHYHAQCSMREDVYCVVKALSQKREALQPENQRFIDHLVRDYERLGLSLKPEARAELKRLKRSVEELCDTFQTNLEEEKVVLSLNRMQLLGLPPDFLKGLEKYEDGNLKVCLNPLNYALILERCRVGATRRTVASAFDQRCLKHNVPILEQLVKLRHKIARFLGYEDHAHYVTAIRMAQSPMKVSKFLEIINMKMSLIAEKELRKLQSLKKAEEENDEFEIGDLMYYIRKAEELEFHLDYDSLKDYFPLEVALKGLLYFQEEILGLKFRKVKYPQAWHPDVLLYVVIDAENGDTIGFFYLDLFSRDGKYKNACVLPLQPSCLRKDGTRQLPVAAMLMSLKKPSNKECTLLEHSEVLTLFHEFIHVMHHVCSCVSFARFSGLRVEDDFVEIPSQIFENWCFERASLEIISGFYKDPKKKLSHELCQTLKRKRQAYAGLLTKRQLLFSFFDQAIHTCENVNTAAVLRELYMQVMNGISMVNGTNLAASFRHLTGGYDAAYYGFLWSEVISADIFHTKFKANVLNNIAGKEFRQKVLAPGACVDASKLVQDYLGREPSEEAFVKSKSWL